MIIMIKEYIRFNYNTLYLILLDLKILKTEK